MTRDEIIVNAATMFSTPLELLTASTLYCRDYQYEVDYWLEACTDNESDPIHRVHSWYLTRVLIDKFNCTFDRSELSEHYVNHAREDEREASIREWVECVNGWENALRSAPIVTLWDGKHLDKVDGWHRMRLARQDGVTEVWCLVGVVESVTENTNSVQV